MTAARDWRSESLRTPLLRLGAVKPSTRFLLYSLLRVGIFAVVLAVLLVIGLEPWLAAVIAAVVGLCISYIFFRQQRDRLALSLVELRARSGRDDDADAENEAIDASESRAVSDGTHAPHTEAQREQRSESQRDREPHAE